MDQIPALRSYTTANRAYYTTFYLLESYFQTFDNIILIFSCCIYTSILYYNCYVLVDTSWNNDISRLEGK